MRPGLLAFLFVSVLNVVCAQLQVSWIFQDHAVLQRDRSLPVWGEATPGQRVTVSFREQTVDTVADAVGRWQVELAPMAANKEGADFDIFTQDERRTFKNVVVGDVWLCAGQSNMEWSVGRAKDTEAEIAAANHPSIRHIKVANFSSRTPLTVARGKWRVSSPEAVRHFSAVGYHFAQEIAQRQDVPVGIINCTWGGTPIEAWLSEPALLSSDAFDVVFARWAEAVATFPERTRAWVQWTKEKESAEARGENFTTKRPRDPSIDYRRQPSGLWGGMVAPLGDFALRGIAWYQGEDNASRPAEYQPLLKTWANDWRRVWPDAPVLLVQLPNYAAGNANGTSWARLREAQAQVAADVADVTLVTTIDLGDANDVHPLDKKSVGLRLAQVARAAVYGEVVAGNGPIFKEMRPEGAALWCSFDHAEGLHSKGKPIGEFLIAGDDQRFYAAEATIEGETIRVRSAEVKEPVAVRYAWRNAPEVTVFNAAGFPLAPFRTDAWPEKERMGGL